MVENPLVHYPREEKFQEGTDRMSGHSGPLLNPFRGAVAVENGEGVIVSGRGIRSEKRLLHKTHGKLRKKMCCRKKWPDRFKRLLWTKKSGRPHEKVRNVQHKATRQLVNFCDMNGVSRLFTGYLSGVNKKRSGRKHSEPTSQ